MGKRFPDNIKKLCDVWEHVLDLMAGPVKGWDWPRTGQQLRMTVGLSGAGKSTWARRQGATVVSSDEIRERDGQAPANREWYSGPHGREWRS
jgi:AAA domain